MWCERRSSPVSLSSTCGLEPSESCERRMLRREGDTLRFGTAMSVSIFYKVGARGGAKTTAAARKSRLRGRAYASTRAGVQAGACTVALEVQSARDKA